MTEKPVRPREPANRDVDAAIEHYLNEASEKVALGFIDEPQKVFARISKTPALVRPGMLMSWICPTCASRQLRGIRTSCSTSSETITLKSGGCCMVSATYPRGSGRETNDHEPKRLPDTQPPVDPQKFDIAD